MWPARNARGDRRSRRRQPKLVASTKLLARLVLALGLTSDERMTLFALALPEIRLPEMPATTSHPYLKPGLLWPTSIM
jgi:hypothetical protein